ncbi:MAG: cell division protein ZapA [Deferribacterales bacterium]
MSPESKEVHITVAGGHYSLRTEHEEVLKKAAGLLEDKFQESSDSSKIVNTHRAVVMAGLKVAVDSVELSELMTEAEAEVDRLNERLNEIDI